MALRIWQDQLAPGQLPTISADTCYNRPIVYALDEHGKPSIMRVSRRIILPTTEFLAPIDMAGSIEKIAKKKTGRFATIDAEIAKAKNTLRDLVASALASLLDTAGHAGNFTMLIQPEITIPGTILLHTSIAMACPPEWRPRPHSKYAPSPEEILSKMRNAEAIATVKKEMLIANIMDD